MCEVTYTIAESCSCSGSRADLAIASYRSNIKFKLLVAYCFLVHELD